MITPPPSALSSGGGPPSTEPTPETAPADPPDPLAQELTLLAGARTALRGGHPDAALTAVETYQARFAHGQLAEEAAALGVEAACAAGQPAAAETRRREFLARWPRSSVRGRVERACR